MRKGWKQIKLGDIIHIKHGYGFKGEYFVEEPNENILVTPGNFSIGGGFKDGKMKYYDGPINDEFVLSEGDVIVTMTDLSKQADTLGYSAKVPKDERHTYLHNQRIGLISLLTKDFDIDFIYWLLRTHSYQKYIAGSSSGATVKHTSPKKIYSTKLAVPKSKETQRKIASILSAYDDLIENNLKRIKLLEEQAQQTYEEWFVRFKFPGFENAEYSEESGMPIGWKVTELGTLVILQTKMVHPRNLPNETPYIGLEHIPRKSFTLSNWETAAKVESAKYSFKKHDILFGKIRPYFHKVGVALIDGIASSDTIILRPKRSNIHGFILQTVFSDHFVDSATQSSNGTKMPRANWNVLKKYPVIIPTNDFIHKYEKINNLILDTISSCVNQNKLLKEARDILLPRLMTGMIDVDSLEVNEGLGMVAEESEKYNIEKK
ncbi:restriction endonuclease subunit S [Arenibacter sp. M-2]|uniref:restriction endonuclease subunit S n=1 Tax=Arenibacter sp. M-2 TaxID=3053612 RepID=UPI0025704DD9|nr:restriction endonuclease subunit S [Arenibacter sp. M-2]MDL5515096.1 restriction endonuclease subunit S [Arenibacter sp. M-2]